MRAPDEVRKRFLGPLVRGEIVGSFATTEPLASSDLRPESIQTVAVRHGDEYVVNGRKRFITNSIVADYCVTLCRDGDRATVLWVDMKAPGVRVGDPDKKLGNRGQITADVVLDHVRVPVAHAIGGPGGGLKAALSILVYGRIGIAAAGVGLAQAAFDIAVDHMKRRQAFGKRLAEFQHWQFRLAERATEIENARNLYLKAAHRLDSGEAFPDPEAAMAKSYCAGVAVDMARDAVQALGGYGFLRELAATGEIGRIEEIYRDSKIGEIYEGTTEIQKWLIARAIFGRDITG
jgi:butyryl-CoA dehydrogenase